MRAGSGMMKREAGMPRPELMFSRKAQENVDFG